MKHVLLIGLISMALASLLAWACTRPPAVEPAPATGKTGAASAPAKAGWEDQWAKTLAAAKQEGTVTIYTVWRPETRTTLTPAFKEKFGIDIEFTPFSRGADLLPKVQTEQRAGLFLADIFGAGNPTLLATMKPADVLGQIKPYVILPEALDSKAWREGAVPFTDQAGTVVPLRSVVLRAVVYNTSMVKEGEITSVKDLLKPQYKEKIAINDPSVPGSGNAFFTHLDHDVWGEAATVDFLRALVRDQKAVIERDNRILMESVARGKYAIAFSPTTDETSNFLAIGAPVKPASTPEDNYATPEAGVLGVPPKLAHPNAATVLINWLLTREGQGIFLKGFKGPGTRVDVSIEGLGVYPGFVPEPGKKYYTETESWLKDSAKWLTLSRKTIDDASK